MNLKNLNTRQKVVLIAVIILLFIIGTNAVIVTSIFSKEYTKALQSEVLATAGSFKLQVDRLLSFGIPLKQLVGFEEQCKELVDKNPEEILSVFIADTEGKILFHSDASIMGESIADREIISRINSSQESVHFYDAISPIFDSDGVILGAVIIHFSEEIISQKIASLFAYISLIAVGFFILAIFLILAAFTRWFTGPLNELLSVIKRIREGDLTKRANINSRDEIGQLAAEFNEMADKLGAYTGELEKKVAERTKELGVKVEELSKSNQELKKAQAAMINLIEDERTLEQSLKEQRDRVKTIISSMGEGLVVADRKNRVILMNQVAERLLETSFDKVRGKDIIEAVPVYRDDKKLVSEEYPTMKVMKTGKVLVSKLEENLYFQTAGGKKFSVLMVIAPLWGNEITGTVMVFRDASEEKKLEDVRSGFISVASHQLRTPLTSMRWFSEMLMAGDVGKISEKQKHFLERIYEGTDRMIGLINLLLQISRVEAGRLKIEPVSIDLRTITQGVLVTLRNAINQKYQKVELKCDPDPFPPIPMDQEVVWQVIQNMISNASRYSPDKSTIVISILKKGKMAEYSVKDSGIGIPQNQQSRIFEKFYRAENALKLVPTGSGLGLSLAKLLVEGWGGKIWFESEEGKGSTFYFTIPLEGMKPKSGEIGITV